MQDESLSYWKAVAELEQLAREEGITLPWPAEAIVKVEQAGAVVDLRTGELIPLAADVPFGRSPFVAKADAL